MPNKTSPSPISWAPSQYWDGDDGQWSSFSIRVGNPGQLVRVLPSTAGSATWVVMPDGCQGTAPNCSDSRGGLFNHNQSSTWKNLGPFTLALELNLNHNESGLYGLDTISLGLTDAVGGPTLESQVIAGIATSHWYTGILGLQQQPMNLSSFTQSEPSFLSSLRTRNLIPSLSWAYTAGAYYRAFTSYLDFPIGEWYAYWLHVESRGTFGSLTFGGSDLARYTPTNVSFALAQDVQRDTVVAIQAITSTFNNGSVSSLLPSPTLAFIDSTVPYIYLPEEACKTFEAQLGLVWNQKQNLYFVDQTLHDTLSNLQPRFTFRLGNDKITGPTVNITLPYSSFDLTIKPPLLPNETSYFPLRRGNDSQITLGRAFLQEAYLITDYDQGNFTVAQAIHNDTAKPQLVPIPWNATVSSASNHHLSQKEKIGISVGSVVLGILILLAIFYILLRRRKSRALTQNRLPELSPDAATGSQKMQFYATHEIGHQSVKELHNISHHIELLNEKAASGSGQTMNELPSKAHISQYELPASMIADGKSSCSTDTMPSSPDEARQSIQEASLSDTVVASDSFGDRNSSSLAQNASLRSGISSRLGRTGQLPISPRLGPNLATQPTPNSVRITDKSSTRLNKPLPKVPPSPRWSDNNTLCHKTLSPAQNLDSNRVSPVALPRAGGRSFGNSMRPTPSPAMSQMSTYAAVFDVEEYTSDAEQPERYREDK
ncbi:uncharacterized protein KY384_004686 [Bacidia gigantensis]|uniref:uncharacterized protein n=1 Tax=Bacidia gigantensis TaxID=2732470 RepID=UPI001D051752|nr:uncharacterized protein KY384_004686 [Bacidia gigantensis]KAG8530186.1 hypothetical protein KY384_004686 [Bacidia gigantensis]